MRVARVMICESLSADGVSANCRWLDNWTGIDGVGTYPLVDLYVPEFLTRTIDQGNQHSTAYLISRYSEIDLPREELEWAVIYTTEPCGPPLPPSVDEYWSNANNGNEGNPWPAPGPDTIDLNELHHRMQKQ
jgi:hypothetical protein